MGNLFELTCQKLFPRKQRRVMSTFWVDPVGGNDGNSGTNPLTDAVKTIPIGLGLLSTKGDILNLLNTGDHTWPISTDEVDLVAGLGTDYDGDPGYTMRGRTATDVVAMTTVKATGGNGVRRIMRCRSGSGFNVIENIIFDATDKAADVSDYNVYRTQDNSGNGPVRIRYCAVLGGVSGTLSDGKRYIYEVVSTAPPTEQFEISYCYVQNCLHWIGTGYSGTNLVTIMHHVCIINDEENRLTGAWSQGALGAKPNADNKFYNNTLYEEISSGSAPIQEHYYFQPSTGVDVGTVDIYNNFAFIENDFGTPASSGIYGAGVASTSITHTGTIGYNVHVYGPSITGMGDLGSIGTYQIPWDPDDSDAGPDDPDIYATDTRVFSTAPSTVFYDPTSTYDWVLPNGLSITILKDLRPILYKTAGLAGAIPGALPAAETDYTVELISDQLNPAVEDTVQFTITISNSGINAFDIEVTAIIPSGLTYIGHTSSTGTYTSGTGVWVITSLPDATSETLIITVNVDAGEEGNDIVFTATQTDGNPSDDPVPGDNTDSVTLSVFIEDPGSYNDPSNIPLLDQYPLRAEIWVMVLNSALRTERNRVRRHYSRGDREDRFFREFSVRRLELAPSTTIEVVIGGIEHGRYLIMESTSQVELSVALGNAADNWTAPATFVLIADSDFETVMLRNPSASVTATVTIGVTD